MKKWLLVLGMVACMAQLTACGSNVQEEEALMSQEMAQPVGRKLYFYGRTAGW